MFLNRCKKLIKPTKNTNGDSLSEIAQSKKLWYLKDQGTVVMTNPPDHLAGLQKVMTSPKRQDQPVIINPQIQAPKNQAAGLKEITTAIQPAVVKKVCHL